MIDTVVLRYKNLQKNFWLINQIVAVSSGYYFRDDRAEVNTDLKTMLTELQENYKQHAVVITDKDIQQIIDHKHNNLNSVRSYLNIKAIVYSDSGASRYPMYRTRHRMRSSNYDLTITVFPDRDFVEFNFSIPKFLYGTNWFQFIPHPGEHGFERFKNTYHSHTLDLYERFRYFVRSFFLKNFINDEVNFKFEFRDLVLNRIDFCYNLIFASEKDAKLYLKCITDQKFKGQRVGSEKIIEHETSVMPYTKAYSKKVYHKGAEFRKNDAVELQKNKAFSNEKIEEIAQLADRTLRFEVTLRNKHLSYLYQTNIWRKDSVKQNALANEAKHGRAYLKIKNEGLENFIERVNSYRVDRARRKNVEYVGDIGRDLINERIEAFKIHEAQMGFIREFNFGFDEGVQKYNKSFTEPVWNKKGQIVLDKEVNLSEDILILWHNFLTEWIKETEVRELPSWHHLSANIKSHNSTIDNYKRTFDGGKRDLKTLREMGKHKK